MIIHKAVLPNGNMNNGPVNLCWTSINDHNHVLDPNMDENMTANVATILLQYMEIGQNDEQIDFNNGEPINMKIKEDNMDEVKRKLEIQGYTLNTEYEISTILAATVNLNFSIHQPATYVCE